MCGSTRTAWQGDTSFPVASPGAGVFPTPCTLDQGPHRPMDPCAAGQGAAQRRRCLCDTTKGPSCPCGTQTKALRPWNLTEGPCPSGPLRSGEQNWPRSRGFRTPDHDQQRAGPIRGIRRPPLNRPVIAAPDTTKGRPHDKRQKTTQRQREPPAKQTIMCSLAGRGIRGSLSPCPCCWPVARCVSACGGPASTRNRRER